jgi:hypothetical protein
VIPVVRQLRHRLPRKYPEHRHSVFSIPKILRRYFLYDRNLLSELSRSAWEALKVYLKSTAPGRDAAPGAVIAIQTFGDFLGFNPHCHILSTDGCFLGTGAFQVAPVVVRKDLEEIFRHKVFKMLLSEGKITGGLVRMLMKQGKHAAGGAFDYVVKNKMIGGFAVIAYPAAYGSSGVMTFIVSHEGVVYQKDLGKNTAKTATAMTSFDPDKTWKKVE